MIIGMMKNSLPVYMQGISKTPLDTRNTRLNLQNATPRSTFYNETTGNANIELHTAGPLQCGIKKTGGPNVAFNSATFSLKKPAAGANGTIRAHYWSSTNPTTGSSAVSTGAATAITSLSTSYTDVTFTWLSDKLFRIGDRITVRYVSGSWDTGITAPFMENDSATTTTDYSLCTANSIGNGVWTDTSTQSPVMTADS